MSGEQEEYEPVRVHVVSSDVRPPAPRQRVATVQYRTVTLTSGSPVQQIRGGKADRPVTVMAQATGSNDVYLAASQASSRLAAGGQLDESFTVAHTNLAPVPYPTSEQVWAAAGTYPATLTVMIISETP